MAKPGRKCRYLVHVDLPRLARNLAAQFQEPCDEMAAARWLCQDKGGERSPFKQLGDWGYFGTRVDPFELLDKSEILHVSDVGE